MISKPEKIIKRIIKAVGQRQAVLVIGEWQEELYKRIKERENSIQYSASSSQLSKFSDNSFTRIIADYSEVFQQKTFFSTARKLLLPTGMIIISANCEDGILEKIISLFKRSKETGKQRNREELYKIKPKILQDQIHDNGFLIDGYYGYPNGHLLMMAQIQNKEVTTLFSSDKQETIVSY